MKISSNVAGGSNVQNNFPHRLLLINIKFESFARLLQIIPQVL